MIIECSGCKAKYKLDEKKIPPTGGIVFCRQCKTKFSLKPSSENVASEVPDQTNAKPTKSFTKSVKIQSSGSTENSLDQEGKMHYLETNRVNEINFRIAYLESLMKPKSTPPTEKQDKASNPSDNHRKIVRIFYAILLIPFFGYITVYGTIEYLKNGGPKIAKPEIRVSNKETSTFSSSISSSNATSDSQLKPITTFQNIQTSKMSDGLFGMKWFTTLHECQKYDFCTNKIQTDKLYPDITECNASIKITNDIGLSLQPFGSLCFIFLKDKLLGGKLSWHTKSPGDFLFKLLTDKYGSPEKVRLRLGDRKFLDTYYWDLNNIEINMSLGAYDIYDKPLDYIGNLSIKHKTIIEYIENLDKIKKEKKESIENQNREKASSYF